ncbi:MAG: ABC transporter ATP-binding protein [Deltaproteobacteria bacterium]|nr:MAG: ABC transporter ATP-binding protein [Deltaproteobacteria bacterium]
MSDVAIRVENLSKRYRIGQREGYLALRDVLARGLKAPFRLLKRDSQNLSRRSNEYIWALKDVSFEVKRGEVVGIIGRNGAGKTTLLKILSRITEPTEGYAEVRGRVGSLLEVGTGFHPELTGRENIYLNGAILGMKKREIDRKFDEIVAFAEVEKFIDTPVKYYSSGMYVRLAFAVAAHLEPEILLVDEVLAVGDAAFQKKCLGKMGDVAKEGRTVLFVSHNMAAIERLCQRALLLDKGNLILSGHAQELVARYLSEKVPLRRSNINLTFHSGRRPGMLPVIVKIRFMDKNSQEKTVFKIGDDIIFEIELDPGKKSFKFPSVSIAIHNYMDQLICKLTTWSQSFNIGSLNVRKVLRCIWRACRLVPGTYFISIGFGNGGNVVDYVEKVANIEILPSGDSLAEGKIPRGIFIPEIDWVVYEKG